jgi:uncharacterized membrane protein YqjE
MSSDIRPPSRGVEERPAGEVAGDLAEDVRRMIDLQVELAKQELRELAVANAMAAGILVTGGLLVVLAVLVALPVVLVTVLPWHWETAVVWTVLYLVAGGAGLLIGRSMLRLEPPRKTLAALKETREWVIQRMRSPSS